MHLILTACADISSSASTAAQLTLQASPSIFKISILAYAIRTIINKMLIRVTNACIVAQNVMSIWITLRTSFLIYAGQASPNTSGASSILIKESGPTNTFPSRWNKALLTVALFASIWVVAGAAAGGAFRALFVLLEIARLTNTSTIGNNEMIVCIAWSACLAILALKASGHTVLASVLIQVKSTIALKAIASCIFADGACLITSKAIRSIVVKLRLALTFYHPIIGGGQIEQRSCFGAQGQRWNDCRDFLGGLKWPKLSIIDNIDCVFSNIWYCGHDRSIVRHSDFFKDIGRANSLTFFLISGKIISGDCFIFSHTIQRLPIGWKHCSKYSSIGGIIEIMNLVDGDVGWLVNIK